MQKSIAVLEFGNIVGSRFVLTTSAQTERFRRGFRSGLGDAEAVVLPGSLLEFWRVLQLCITHNRIVICQASNTSLTEGATPKGRHSRKVVIINTLRLCGIQLIEDGKQVLCYAGAKLHELEDLLSPLGREPHSVIGSSCIGASVVGGICNNSGGTLVQRGPAYTELALFARLTASGHLELVNHLGISLGDTPEEILTRLDRGNISSKTVALSSGAASDRDYATRVRDINADTPARFNANPERLFEASGSAGKIAILAVRLDTFPAAQLTNVYYVGTNNVSDFALLRNRLLTNSSELPISCEYIHRTAYDLAERYGRDTRRIIELFGTRQMPKLFAIKGRAEGLCRRLGRWPQAWPDIALQALGWILPGQLPPLMKKFHAEFEHHIVLKISDSIRTNVESILTECVGPSNWNKLDSKAARTALLHRFAVAGAAIRYVTLKRRSVDSLVALDVAFRRNDHHWFKALPPELASRVDRTLYYGHFLCNVFHIDHILKSGVDSAPFKARVLTLFDQEGAEYPAEHNVGHVYRAKEPLAKFYDTLDSSGTFNPGIGESPNPCGRSIKS